MKIKFSEPVNITKDISSVIQIKQKTVSRRLMQTVYEFVDYTIYDYGDG